MRRLAFKKQYKAPILTGRKVTTIRASTDLIEGDIVAFTCEWGKPPFAMAVVDGVEELHRSAIDPEIAEQDGFPSPDLLRKELDSFYPGREFFSLIRFSLWFAPRGERE